MTSVFLFQLAAGVMLMAALTRSADVSPRYLRLLARVCAALMVAGVAARMAERGWRPALNGGDGLAVLAAAAFSVGWLAASGAAASRGRAVRRVWPLVGAAFALAAAAGGVLSGASEPPDAAGDFPAGLIYGSGGDTAVRRFLATGVSLGLGAALLGAVTAGMLLGHRYLTDRDMTIAPLRRMTGLFGAAVAARIAWVGVILWPVATAGAPPGVDATWLWLMVGLRVGAGLIGTGAFAYMTWDCVRRRSTQSATGILYLAMVFAFTGELTAQYLLRTRGLAV